MHEDNKALPIGQRKSDDEMRQIIDEAMAKSAEILAKVPPREMQKLFLCNLAFGNFDMKWDNVLFDTEVDGTAKGRPFDAGAAIPAVELGSLHDQVFADDGAPAYGLQLLINPVTQQPLTFNDPKSGAKVSVADAPIDKGLRDMFLAIKIQDLEDAAKKESEKLHKQSDELDPTKLGIESGLSTSKTCIEGIQRMLADNPQLTTSEFLEGFQKKVMSQIVNDNKDTVTRQVIAQYRGMRRIWGDCLPEEDKLTPKKMYDYYTSARAQMAGQ